MQVRHRLACSLTGVRDDAETCVEALLRGYLGYDLEDVRHDRRVLSRDARRGVRDVLLRDDQYMSGCLGVDIPEGHDLLVLIYLVALYLAGNHFAEQAIIVPADIANCGTITLISFPNFALR